MFFTENKEKLEHILIAFYNHWDYQRSVDPNLPIGPIRDGFIKNEMDIEQSWAEICKQGQQIMDANLLILKDIKTRKGKAFHKHVVACIKESEGSWDWPFELIQNPIGDYQEDKWGHSFKGVWVDQRSVGMEGDSYEGTICIQIETDQYLKFHFSM